MSKLIVLLFAFLLATSCNNNKKSSIQNDKSGKNDSKVSIDSGKGDKNRDNNSQFNWTKKEQNQFLEDCRKESEEDDDNRRVNDLCSCFLREAQKYYPSYRQMDEKSNDDHDKEIFAECVGKYKEKEE